MVVNAYFGELVDSEELQTSQLPANKHMIAVVLFKSYTLVVLRTLRLIYRVLLF